MTTLMVARYLSTALATVVLLSSGIGLRGQSHPFLGKFYADKIDHSVHLGWVILAGNTCNGIQIFRSVDSVHFEPIGNLSGICGSLTSSQHYAFVDRNPVKNQINYYRLELGGNGQSQIIAIEIVDLLSAGFQIRPHPVCTESNDLL